jgi:hypothetical protein
VIMGFSWAKEEIYRILECSYEQNEEEESLN